MKLGRVCVTPNARCRAALFGCGLGCVAIVVTDLLSSHKATMNLQISLDTAETHGCCL